MRVALLLSIALAAGCGNHGKQVCRKAGTKVAACFEKTLGQDEMVRTAQANATSDISIAVCAADDRTVKAYDDCLDIDDCGKFMECVESHAAP